MAAMASRTGLVVPARPVVSQTRSSSSNGSNSSSTAAALQSGGGSAGAAAARPQVRTRRSQLTRIERAAAIGVAALQQQRAVAARVAAAHDSGAGSQAHLPLGLGQQPEQQQQQQPQQQQQALRPPTVASLDELRAPQPPSKRVGMWLPCCP
jgi:hypothetical protein